MSDTNPWVLGGIQLRPVHSCVYAEYDFERCRLKDIRGKSRSDLCHRYDFLVRLFGLDLTFLNFLNFIFTWD